MRTQYVVPTFTPVKTACKAFASVTVIGPCTKFAAGFGVAFVPGSATEYNEKVVGTKPPVPFTTSEYTNAELASLTSQ